MLEVKNISKNYKKNKIKVLDDINYKFENGKFYFIVGKSGAGKSTLIQLLGLLITPSSGEIIIDNQKVSTLNDKEKSSIRNKKIGFIFQSYYLDPLLKAYENVMLPMYLDTKLSKDEIKNKACKLLKMVDLEGRINHFPKELSGGEQQRVAIARALSNDPDIILADEQTGSLDKVNEEKILEILKELSKKGKCVIVVSHNLETKKYADKVISINNHKLEEVEDE